MDISMQSSEHQVNVPALEVVNDIYALMNQNYPSHTWTLYIFEFKQSKKHCNNKPQVYLLYRPEKYSILNYDVKHILVFWYHCGLVSYRVSRYL